MKVRNNYKVFDPILYFIRDSVEVLSEFLKSANSPFTMSRLLGNLYLLSICFTVVLSLEKSQGKKPNEDCQINFLLKTSLSRITRRVT